MNRASEKAYFQELAARNTQRLLINTFTFLSGLSLVMSACSILLVVVLATQCTSILGLSLNGRIFETDSKSCPNPRVEPIYHRQQSGLNTAVHTG